MLLVIKNYACYELYRNGTTTISDNYKINLFANNRNDIVEKTISIARVLCSKILKEYVEFFKVFV